MALPSRFLAAAGHALRSVVVWLDDTEATLGTSPTITAEPNGSIYLRTDGATYTRVGGAWVIATTAATANTWDLLQTYTVGVRLADSGVVEFGTAGTDFVVTADGTDAIATGTGDFVFVDSLDLKFGTGKDIGIAWDGTRLNVTQAATNSEIRWGVDGAGIDQIWYGDTASASMTWDQTADSLVLAGVAKIKLQTIAAADGTAIPVTHSGSFAVTTAAAETNTLADPTFLGQTLTIFVDTYAVGDRVITAASRINQAGNTIITLGAAEDVIKLEAITVAGALKWQVIANDGAALS